MYGASVCNGGRNHIQVHRRHQRGSLTDGKLGHILLRRIRCQRVGACSARKIVRKRFSEHHVVQKRAEGIPVQTVSDIDKCTVTGFCKSLFQAYGAVRCPMVAMNRLSVFQREIIVISDAVVAEGVGCRHIFVHQLNGIEDLKRRTRRIQSLCHTIHQRTGIRIRAKPFPFRFNIIRVKIRLGHHAEDISGIHLRYNDCTAIVAEGVGGSLLKRKIQRCIDIICGISLARRVIRCLIRQRNIRMHQIVILKLLHTASALIGVADDMGKQVFIRIGTDIVSVLILNGLRKNLSAGSIDLSADILLKQRFFSFIVIVLKELLRILVRINQEIDRHRRKQRADQSARHKDLLPDLGLFS